MTTTTFASLVKNAAEKTPAAGRFGSKVWIHAAWAVSGTDLSLDEFKAALWAAHQAGALTLSRADLVEALDPFDVRRSRLVVEGGTFNFIRL